MINPPRDTLNSQRSTFCPRHCAWYFCATMKQLVPFSKTSATLHCMKLPSCQDFRLPSSSQQFLFSKNKIKSGNSIPEEKGGGKPPQLHSSPLCHDEKRFFPPLRLLQDLEAAKEPLDASLERLFSLSPKSCVALQQILLYHLLVRKTQKYKFIGKVGVPLRHRRRFAILMNGGF